MPRHGQKLRPLHERDAHLANGEQWCARCSTWKPLDAFGADRSRRSGKQIYCRPCRATVNAEYRPGYDIERVYGITLDDYETMFDKQGRVCAICQRPRLPNERRFDVDHNHDTGKVRGILCGACNTGLGHFGDDIHLLVRAENYLLDIPDEPRYDFINRLELETEYVS
jgi:hypothetical protein